jgi:fibronectin-binding autotransporter adhesin
MTVFSAIFSLSAVGAEPDPPVHSFINHGTLLLDEDGFTADNLRRKGRQIRSGTLSALSGAALINRTHATIFGNGTLIAAPIENHGAIEFNGPTDVAGALSNLGTIRIAGESTTTFFGPVVHNGEAFEIAANSRAVFLDRVSGTGAYTGTGEAFFNGTLAPGNSPGLLTIGGNITFGPFGILEIEIGGLLRGTEYDALDVGGTATLDGTLNNYGSLNNESGGTLNNSGELATYGLSTSLTNNGTLNNQSGGTLTSGLGEVKNVGVLNNDGTIVVVPGASLTNEVAGNLNNAGTLNNSGMFTHYGALTQDAGAQSGSIVNSGSGQILVYDGIVEGGLLSNEAAANVDIQGIARWQGGTILNSGTMSLFKNYPGVGSPAEIRDAVVRTQDGGLLTVGDGGLITRGSVEAFGVGSLLDIQVGSVVEDAIVQASNSGTVNVDGDIMGNLARVQVFAGGSLTGGGTIAADVFITNGGVFGPGNSPGTMTIIGNHTQDAGSTLLMELAGLTPGIEHDVLDVFGTAALDGILDVDLLGGFNPQAGDIFDILMAESITGQFGSLLFPALNPSLKWGLQYLFDVSGSTDVLRLSAVTTVPIPGAVWLFGSTREDQLKQQ